MIKKMNRPYNEYHYSNVLPIDAFQSSVWLVEFQHMSQQLSHSTKQLHVWHKKAKIEDIVEAIKLYDPEAKFTVAAVDVGTFNIESVANALSNGRKLNQDMIVVV